jgi:prolyl oligopeptidase
LRAVRFIGILSTLWGLANLRAAVRFRWFIGRGAEGPAMGIGRTILPLAALAALAACAPTEKLPAPPPTRMQPVVTSYHGVRVADPYRWLDSAGAPEVRAWIDAQNTYTDTVLARFPEGRVINERVRQLLTTSPEQSEPRLVGGTLFFLRETPPEAQAVLVAQVWPDGRPRVLVNPNRSGGRTAIGGVWPSPRGRYVAYGTSRDGKPATTLHVVEAATGRTLADSLADAGGGPSPAAVLWDADERGFVYARYPGAAQWFGIALHHHALGARGTDPVAFGARYSPVAEFRLLASADGTGGAILANAGDGSPAEVYLRTARGWRRAADTALGVRDAAFVGERLLAIASGGSPRGRLVALTADGAPETVVPQGERAMHAVAPIEGGFLLTTIWGPDWQLDQYAADGRFLRTAPLPPATAVGVIASAPDAPEALVTYDGWTVPQRWARYNGRSGTLTTVFEVKAAGDYGRVTVHRFDAVSTDGARVPVTVLALDGTPQDGAAPTILTSYGGFDLPVAPGFIGPDLAWLERGGVLAYANIRGGSEFGEEWHQGGMLTRKQNVFNDFYAAARGLVQQRWTTSGRLGIRGASNGGLLMGTALTQHPEAYRAVAAFAGIYDMMRHADIPNGRYNVPEYGSAADPAQFAAQYGYSALYHVVKGARYPAVLLETGVNDPLVAPWQSREFAAALQASSTSRHPVALLTRFDAGHGSASFSQRVGNTAVMLTFLAHELGLKTGN